VPAPDVLLSREQLGEHVERIAREIERDHPDGVVLVGVLKGALLFTADLARAIRAVDVMVDFIAISRFAADTGRVRFVKDVELDLTGRDVVVVEDMVDTGLTATFLLAQLRTRGARRVELATLLDRPVRRIVPLEARYRGVEIPDVFALGYGLHVAELYRNVPAVYTADRARIQADPGAYVADLYGVTSRAEPEASS
jgi:hypoxanthine phosphoribosyltransferase